MNIYVPARGTKQFLLSLTHSLHSTRSTGPKRLWALWPKCLKENRNKDLNYTFLGDLRGLRSSSPYTLLAPIQNVDALYIYSPYTALRSVTEDHYKSDKP